MILHDQRRKTCFVLVNPALFGVGHDFILTKSSVNERRRKARRKISSCGIVLQNSSVASFQPGFVDFLGCLRFEDFKLVRQNLEVAVDVTVAQNRLYVTRVFTSVAFPQRLILQFVFFLKKYIVDIVLCFTVLPLVWIL